MGIVGTQELRGTDASRRSQGPKTSLGPDHLLDHPMNLSAPIALVVIALLTALSWVAAYCLGGSSDELLGRNETIEGRGI